MAELPAQPAESNSETTTTSISDLFEILSCCVNTTECQHDTNPWSDSDPELQNFSTAALEALQEHAAYRMESLLHMHEVLDKELVDRKIEARFVGTSIINKCSGEPSELLFNTHDFEPLNALLEAQDSISESHSERSKDDHRDVIAKMCLAWITEEREAARACRIDVTRRPASVKHRTVDEAGAIVDVEDGETSPITFQDVEALEDEMEVYC